MLYSTSNLKTSHKYIPQTNTHARGDRMRYIRRNLLPIDRHAVGTLQVCDEIRFFLSIIRDLGMFTGHFIFCTQYLKGAPNDEWECE